MATINDTSSTRRPVPTARGMAQFTGSTPIAPTSIGQMAAPRQPTLTNNKRTIARMPTFAGPPARAASSATALSPARAAYQARALQYANAVQPVMGAIGGANRLNESLKGTGLSRITNPIMAGVNTLASQGYGALAQQAPVMSHPYQLQKLIGEGWYTPKAQTSLYSVPYQYDRPGPGRAFYAPGENKFLYPPGYWENKTNIAEPWRMTEDVRHEAGHYFDVGPGGGRYSSNQDFINAAKRTDAAFFPGLGLKPGIGEVSGGFLGIGNKPGWGGPAEAYADIGRNPYWFRKLSQWYPRYTSTAYNMPAFAGTADLVNQDRTWQYEPTAGRGPYTDIANRNFAKRVTVPEQSPLYYDYQRGTAQPPR